MQSRSFKAMAAIFLLAGAVQAASVPGAYVFKELGNVQNQQTPLAINNAGEAVGTVVTPCCPSMGAIFWTATGDVLSASKLPYRQEYFLGDINNAGQVLGHVVSEPGRPIEGWTIENLPGKSLISNNDGFALNDLGQVIGGAALYNAGGQALSTVGTLGGDINTPRDLNNTGMAVGSSRLKGNGASHAFSWQGGVLKDLGTLGGSNSDAYGVNEDGVVVGESQLSGDAVMHAVRWNAGKITDLGTLGGRFSGARAINHAGAVVGFAENSAGAKRAALWSGNTAIDLNTFVPAGTLAADTVLSEAYAINDAGQILVKLATGGVDQLRGGWLMTPSGTSTVSCVASYQVTSTVNLIGFAVKVTVANLSDAPLTGWNVGWTYSSNPFIIVSSNAKLKVSRATVKATPMTANQTVPAHGQTSFTFTSLKGKTIPTVNGMTAELGGKACLTIVE